MVIDHPRAFTLTPARQRAANLPQAAPAGNYLPRRWIQHERELQFQDIQPGQQTVGRTLKNGETGEFRPNGLSASGR
jgi:hypothetical protein